ncbi:MAG: hypothetical protein PVG38_05425 [Gammaproteobacteria bacterium]|jgi:hypothetical protein
MTTINSDAEFRAALAGLSTAQQRILGKRFVDSVGELIDNPKVEKVLEVVEQPDVSEQDLADGCRVASAAARERYTLCGRETDWLRQASHFCAAAAAACLAPAQEGDQEAPAWNAAMNARMARVCEKIARGEDYDNGEVTRQYELLQAFLDSV